MLSAGPIPTGQVHELETGGPRVELLLRVLDPLTDDLRPLPAGVGARLLGEGHVTPFGGTSDAQGRVSFLGSDEIRGVSLFIDFGGARFLDVEAWELVHEREVNDTRALIGLPPFWRSDEATAMFDDLGGRCVGGVLPELVEAGQGTAEAPWEIRIDHDWRRIDVVFEYYDRHNDSVVPLPYGGFVEAFWGNKEEPEALVGASTVLTASGIASVPLFRPCPGAELHLRLSTAPGSCVRLDEEDPRKKVVRPSPDEVVPRGLFYPLPERWLARGQICMPGMAGVDKKFEDAVDAALAPHGLPLHFDLDDLVLVREDGRPLRFERPRRMTLFDEAFKVLDRDPKAPCFSQQWTSHNLLRASNHYRRGVTDGGPPLRVIQRARSFFEVGNRRTTKGKVIGARAAVGNAHPHVRWPKAGLPHTSRARADVHYFEDVGVHRLPGVEGDRVVDVALIFVSARLRPMGDINVPARFEQLRARLADAAEIWAGKEAKGTPIWISSRSTTRDVRVVFHFVAFEFGLAMLDIFLWDPWDYKRAYVGAGMHLDVEHDLHTRTVAHELGHVLGFEDEYPARVSKERAVPTFNQSGRLQHLAHDEMSLLNDSTGKPRLRHYWAFARWISGIAVSAVADGNYELVCAGPARTHIVDWHEGPLPFEVLRGPQRFEPGATGRVQAMLAALGDELDAVPELPACDSVVHVLAKCYVSFRRNIDGDGFDLKAKNRFLLDLYREASAVDGNLKARELFTLELDLTKPASEAAKSHVRRVFVHVHPRFSTRNPAAADLRLIVRKPSANGCDAPQVQRRRVAVLDTFTGTALRAHVLGRSGRQQPYIQVISTYVGGKLTFNVPGTEVVLKSAETRTSGDNTFVGKRDGPSAPVPIPAHEIARNIAEAINDPANAAHPIVSATVGGDRVILAPRIANMPLTVRHNTSGTRIGLEWDAGLEADALVFLADWVGAEVGGSYLVRKHVL